MPAKTYKVTKQFTDQKGRAWKVGENFTGDEQAIQQAKQAGQITEASAGDPNAQPEAE
jgi:hypothetical protein